MAILLEFERDTDRKVQAFVGTFVIAPALMVKECIFAGKLQAILVLAMHDGQIALRNAVALVEAELII